jgi:hypothetical protein
VLGLKAGADLDLHAMERTGCAPIITSRCLYIINRGSIGLEFQRRSRPVYNWHKGEFRHIPGLPRVLIDGGGDQGEFAEKSTHLKPPENSGSLVNPKIDTMKQDNKVGAAA